MDAGSEGGRGARERADATRLTAATVADIAISLRNLGTGSKGCVPRRARLLSRRTVGVAGGEEADRTNIFSAHPLAGGPVVVRVSDSVQGFGGGLSRTRAHTPTGTPSFIQRKMCTSAALVCSAVA